MALSQMIQEYEDACCVLTSAIKDDWIEKVKVMDITVNESFDRILAVTPDNEAEKKLLIDFLLKKLSTFSADGELYKKTNSKVVELMQFGFH